MKIAVPYENGQISPRFGEAKQFMIYSAADDEILSTELIDIKNQDPSAMTTLLTEQGIHVLICSNIDVKSVLALRLTPIQLMGGATGEAEQAVKEFLGGKLHFETTASCAGCPASFTKESGEIVECDGNISACRYPL